jgi:hypothetical protein
VAVLAGSAWIREDGTMTAIARLAAVSLDSSDPVGLAAFYKGLLDVEVFFENEDFVALKGAGILITTQRVSDHRAPDWPANEIPKQIHLEPAVDDLEASEVAALALGATKATTQPNPESWRVMVGPVRPSVLHHHADPRGLTGGGPTDPAAVARRPSRRRRCW